MKNLLQKVPCLALVVLLCAFVSCAKEDDMPDRVNSECLDFTSKAPGEFAKLDRYRYVNIDSLIIRGRMNDQDFRQLLWLIRYGRLSSINLENAEPEEVDSVVFEQTEKYTSPLHKIIMPKHLKKVPAKAFRGCYTLENIVLPEQCESIGDSAFWGCENIRSFRIPATCLSIGKYAFGECKKLSDMHLPSNLKKIPEGMFYDCDSLKEIVIPAGVDEIGERTFEYSGLERIDLPMGIKKIADGTFHGCRSLQGITIPDDVERIEEEAFAYAGLKRIHLPKNLKYLGPFALRSIDIEELILPASLGTIEGGACVCLTSLKQIYCLAATPPKCNTIEYAVGNGRDEYYYTTGAFGWMKWPYNQDYTKDNTPRNIPVYVPNGSANLYRKAGWWYFQNIIETDQFPDL